MTTRDVAWTAWEHTGPAIRLKPISLPDKWELIREPACKEQSHCWHRMLEGQDAPTMQRFRNTLRGLAEQECDVCCRCGGTRWRSRSHDPEQHGPYIRPEYMLYGRPHEHGLETRRINSLRKIPAQQITKREDEYEEEDDLGESG